MKLPPDCHFGFIRNKLTKIAVVSFTNHIQKAFDNNEFTIAICFSLTKAFETVYPPVSLWYQITACFIPICYVVCFIQWLQFRLASIILWCNSRVTVRTFFFLMYINDFLKTSYLKFINYIIWIISLVSLTANLQLSVNEILQIKQREILLNPIN